MKSYMKMLQKVKLAAKYFVRVIKVLAGSGTISMILIAIFALVSGITPSLSVLVMQKIINALQLSNQSIHHLTKLLAVYVSIDIINGVILLCSGYIESKFQMKASLAMNISILEKLKEFSLRDFEDSETYNSIQKAINVGISRMFSFFKSFILLVQLFINVVLFSLILGSWKWWLIPIVLVIPLTNTLIITFFGNKQFHIRMKRAGKERKQAYFQYLLTNDIAFKEIKIFDIGRYFREKYRMLGIEFLDQDNNLLKKRTAAQSILHIFEQTITTFVFMFIILKTYVGDLLLGELTAYTRSISNIKSSTQTLLSHINSIYENMLYISKYFEFIDRKCIIEDVKIDNQQKSDALSIPCIPYIEIKNLSYKYKDQKGYAINRLNLKIEGNSLVALIGKNGSGKTTLVKILSTLYKDYDGDIYYGNNNLGELNPEVVRNRIGILFQDFVKYELTARENIALAQQEKMEDSAALLDALSKTGMQYRISDLDMQLGFWFDEGVQLSGGEWLRIALSRAFIRDADLYLLDEPNAALDAVSEKLMLKSFKELTAGKIGIIVSHRIASVKNIADKIIVFDHGSIEASGTHDELLETSNTYRELYYNETST